MATRTSNHLISKLDPEFGQWLRGTRSGAGFNLTDFAAAANLHQDTLRVLEMARRLEGVYTVEVFKRIADALGMELGYVLHKAGFDLGRDGIDLQRLARVELVADAFAAQESDLRVALADALTYVDTTPGPMRTTESEQRRDALIVALGRGLAALDRVTERIRKDGFVAARGTAAGSPEQSAVRPWTPSESQFLLDNPRLSHADAAAHIGRSASAVRAQRSRLNGESS